MQCEAGCQPSYGADQPAYVTPTAPQPQLPGVCLVNTHQDLLGCSGRHTFTRRLCPCSK